MLIVGARGIDGNEGGVEKFAEEFAKRAARHLDLSVLCLDGGQPSYDNGVRLIKTRATPFGKTDKLMYYGAAARVCLAERFDYVFLLGINSAWIGLVVKSMFFRRTFLLARSGSVDYVLDKWGLLGKIYFRLSEQGLRFADLVIAVSPSIQKHLAAKGFAAKLIPNGLALSGPARPRLRPAGRPVVIAVGRLTPQKNYSLLLDAAWRLRDEITVKIIGGPDQSGEESRLREIIQARALRNVEMTGALRREDVFRELARASVYVNCSTHEGMSNSVLEAIQHRVPLALSDIDANRDLSLADHVYFKSGDVQALAETIRAACRMPYRFIASPERFRNWDEIVAQILTEIGVPPQAPRPVGAIGASAAPTLQRAAAFKD
jgi:glycosyltransferase involved in cell wall biosynthesis